MSAETARKNRCRATRIRLREEKKVERMEQDQQDVQLDQAEELPSEADVEAVHSVGVQCSIQSGYMQLRHQNEALKRKLRAETAQDKEVQGQTGVNYTCTFV